MNEKAFEAVEERRCGPLICRYPYDFVDSIYLKRSWGGFFENVTAMVAVGVNEDGAYGTPGRWLFHASPIGAVRSGDGGSTYFR